MSSIDPYVQRRWPMRRIVRPLEDFIQQETASGLVLLLFAVIALIWANSPWGDAYEALWHTEFGFTLGNVGFAKDLGHWINDGLMVIFFFVVGLEIKREVMVGELSSRRQASLPVAAAIGGMAVPAAIYLVFNFGGPEADGWGVPMATDIAFALGVMALLGSRIPPSLKTFLVGLAIVDDIGAVLVIALFYTSTIEWALLGVGGVILGILFIFNWSGVRHPMPYAALGVALWLAFLESGVHATIAGVLLALTIPARSAIDTRDFLTNSRGILDDFSDAGEHGVSVLTNERRQSALQALVTETWRVQTPLQCIEHLLQPWAFFVVMPIFALANAGVRVDLQDLGSIVTDRVPLGIVFGLVIGKQVGVTLFAWGAVRLGLATLPKGVRFGQVYGAAWLAGIGFTMSLFISTLAFADPGLLEKAKIGILVASLIAGCVGYLLLRSVFASRSVNQSTQLRQPDYRQ